jgi:hypothetical protein
MVRLLNKWNWNGIMAETILFKCETVGVSGTTPVHVKQNEQGGFVARCGIALMGSTQLDEAGFEACGYDPFHPEFYDNWVEGFEASEAEAINNLKTNMKATANSLWI